MTGPNAEGNADRDRGSSADDDADDAENGTASGPTVRRLSDATVGRIAAGEVITRPARVVAELLDNALDAGASRVDVAVAGDGTETIRVTDDGHGMSRENALRAVERHATSKLRDGEEPAGVASLGFRGEALSAIAAAGRLELVTNDGGAVGTRVDVVGDPAAGEVGVADAGRARGTTVVVRDLFADRPARRATLGGTPSEFARISALVADYALARPDVAFTLDHDGSTTLSTPGTGRTEALLGVYDRETAGQSTTFEHDAALASDEEEPTDAVTVTVAGILAYPSISRAARDHVRVSVNGRPVENASLRAAVRKGYGSLLPDGREPVAAVDVRLPPREVDPNVHPAKREVALRHAERIRKAVATGVEDALTGADLRRKAEVATDLETGLAPVEGEAPFAAVEPIGQYRELYLLCDAGDELLVIDAHAAHERVNYERLRRAFADATVPTAELDPPVTLSLSAAEAATVEATADRLRRLGFDVEPFGSGTVRVRAVPAPFGRTLDPGAVRDAVAALRAGTEPADAREELCRDLACHPSLKRGDALDGDEARQLLDRLGECERPFSCPHGRPTVLSLDEATLAAGFERGSRR